MDESCLDGREAVSHAPACGSDDVERRNGKKARDNLPGQYYVHTEPKDSHSWNFVIYTMKKCDNKKVNTCCLQRHNCRREFFVTRTTVNKTKVQYSPKISPEASCTRAWRCQTT